MFSARTIELIELRRLIDCSYNTMIFDDDAINRFRLEVLDKMDKIITESKKSP